MVLFTPSKNKESYKLILLQCRESLQKHLFSFKNRYHVDKLFCYTNQVKSYSSSFRGLKGKRRYRKVNSTTVNLIVYRYIFNLCNKGYNRYILLFCLSLVTNWCLHYRVVGDCVSQLKIFLAIGSPEQISPEIGKGFWFPPFLGNKSKIGVTWRSRVIDGYGLYWCGA